MHEALNRAKGRDTLPVEDQAALKMDVTAPLLWLHRHSALAVEDSGITLVGA